MSWQPKIFQLPGARLTPDTVLARSLSKAARMRAALVVIEWDDGTIDFDWSQMTLSQLAFMQTKARIEVDAVLRGERDGHLVVRSPENA